MVVKKVFIDPKTDPEMFKIIISRYHRFIDALTDPKIEPVSVFDPLTKRQLDELAMIRELSQTLQQKKEDDVQKAAAAKQAAEDAKKEEANNKKEEKLEETDKKVTEEMKSE